LRGKYAFCILENRPNGDSALKSQYLLIKPMYGTDDSEHGFAELYKKRIPGYDKTSSKLIVGGEIIFKNGEIEYNLESGGYSNIKSDGEDGLGPFHYRNENFEHNLETRLWIPGRHVYPDHLKPLKKKLSVCMIGKGLGDDDSSDIELSGTEKTRSTTHLHTLERIPPVFRYSSGRQRLFGSSNIPCSSSEAVRRTPGAWKLS
jgi:hypothetical protein